MTCIKDIKKEVLDSMIVSADNTQIALRTKSGWLYFYRGLVKSISGVHLIDDKYGSEGLPLKSAQMKDYVFEVKKGGEFLVVIHEGLEFEGRILERVLQENSGFKQVIHDF